MRPARPRLALLALSSLVGCATLAPGLGPVYLASDADARDASRFPPVLVLVGDVGVPRGEQTRVMAGRIARRMAGAPDAPVLILGDVFYTIGLVGTCPADGEKSTWRCGEPGTPGDQLERVLGPYRDALPGNPVIGIGGNHDYYGGEQATANACSLLHTVAPGWRYIARGCGLDDDHPVETLDLGSVVVFVLDSEPMIRDGDFRAASVEALRSEIRRYRSERPGAWRVVATHHPLETYGSHNGSTLGTALLKDFYALRKTVLYPLFFPFERWLGQQDVYELRYRSYRRALYDVFRDEPIDAFVSGHDHNLQHIALEEPGVPWQVVSGSGAQRSSLKRFGQDLLWTNRLARLLFLGRALPAPRHELRFGMGGAQDSTLRSGYGFAVLAPDRESMVVEYYDARSDAPVYATSIER